MKNLSRGFTLIEVLVVVLIIGILTSVALPQYQKAVVKARVFKLMPLIRAIDSAQQVYYSTYMRYAEKFDDLDITMPAGGSMNSDGNSISYKDFYCWIQGGNKSVYCNSKDPNAPQIEKYFNVDYFICWHGTDKAKEKICASLSGSQLLGGRTDGYTFQ